MKRIIIIFLAVTLSVGLYACGNQITESDKPIIAVTIVPQAAFVEAVAGDLVEIITIIPPGYSPGNYEPSAKTMAELSDAALYFTIGVPAEVNNIIPGLDSIEVVSLEDIVNDTYEDLTFSGGGRDPHIWLSISRVIIMVETIAEKLIEIDPTNETTYTANSTTYIAQLTAALATIEAIFEDITMNKFIVFHPSYQYFAAEFGLEMNSLEEDGKEATAQHLTEIIDLANLYNIEYVFYQVEIDSSQVESFADEIDATIVELDPLSADYINNIVVMANLIREALR
ncbi:MAG: zinc ABC transporter substrate-binding protein [Tenericutes bacterium]|nr:zinc ABC transporter substrate-binding protein [Mycoplasmatota bacterium]